MHLASKRGNKLVSSLHLYSEENHYNCHLFSIVSQKAAKYSQEWRTYHRNYGMWSMTSAQQQTADYLLGVSVPNMYPYLSITTILTLSVCLSLVLFSFNFTITNIIISLSLYLSVDLSLPLSFSLCSFIQSSRCLWSLYFLLSAPISHHTNVENRHEGQAV